MLKHLLAHFSRSGQFFLEPGHEPDVPRLTGIMKTSPQRQNAFRQQLQFLPFVRQHRLEQFVSTSIFLAEIPFSTS